MVPGARLGLIRIWVRVVIALFSEHTASGGGRFGWTVFLILLPWLAVFVSLQARGTGSNESALAAAAQQKATTDNCTKGVAAQSRTPAEQIADARPPACLHH